MARNTQNVEQTQPKVGIVLSSGGLKSIASVALFDFLDEENIETDLQIGCSGGAVMSCLRGAGYDTKTMVELCREFASLKVFSQINYRSILSMANLPFGHYDTTKGLLKNQLPRRMSRKMFGTRLLEDLKPKTVLQATDLKTGEGVILSEGLVADAVYASGAIAPLFPPIQLDGRLLADGAYSNPLPIMEAVKRDVDVIIAMVFQDKLVSETDSFFESFNNIIRSFSLALVKSQLTISIDFHHYEIIVINMTTEKPIALTAVEEIPYLLDAGYKAVEARKAEILDAINNFRDKSSG